MGHKVVWLVLGVATALLAPEAAAQGMSEPLRVSGVTVLTLRASAGGFGPRARIARIEQRAHAIIARTDLDPEDVEVEVGPDERTATVWVGRELLVTATPADATANDTTPERLAHQWARNFRRAFERARETRETRESRR